MTQFQYNSYISIKDNDLNGKTINEYLFQLLICYDYYEEYDSNKTYITNQYIFSFSNDAKRIYINKLVTYQYNNNQYQYVVAHEILNNDDKKLLKKYCQCEKHTTSRFNPKRYLLGSFDVGCIDSDFPAQFVIWKTRQYIKNNNII